MKTLLILGGTGEDPVPTLGLVNDEADEYLDNAATAAAAANAIVPTSQYNKAEEGEIGKVNNRICSGGDPPVQIASPITI